MDWIELVVTRGEEVVDGGAGGWQGGAVVVRGDDGGAGGDDGWGRILRLVTKLVYAEFRFEIRF